MTVERLREAYLLSRSLSNTINAFTDGLFLVHHGRFADAHYWLAEAGMAAPCLP